MVGQTSSGYDESSRGDVCNILGESHIADDKVTVLVKQKNLGWVGLWGWISKDGLIRPFQPRFLLA